ncbi:ABC transporter ATP-binding protein [Oceanomicrobium pacificus]|uniref:sn-glycerol-3-phosphate ABC transporter ATP-binding protein UgpC n=1 Tax=Oceanomicrobium pacificus TaxID=2692916 RepID=A0A6B0TQ32_9RHOB|nr:sn-glycerol-3-phosphate ABC transporter ATP-binding protein UgpC [Oceanomicrobium pacificus]MXU64789.1 sn-glycerol-3-phosphate ABC transporter ATP-binding protein UgpC [Oceanomicrobium pacificus]
MAEIQLRSISKRWGSFVGVHKFDLTIADREFLVLLGPSGCGKTTTMRMIAGLEDVTDGEIAIDGRVVNDLEPKDRDVAMVFQSYALYPNMNVYENIRFPLKVRGVDTSTHEEKVQRAARMVELTDFLHRKPAELSGGQRQRVALARAIVREPNVFLMDEPLSNLDAKLRVSTRAQIKNLSHELAVTTIYVTHDQIEAMTLADRVVVMKQGRVQQVGSPTEIYDNPANTFVASFIGSPAMNLIDGDMAAGRFTAPSTDIGGLDVPDGPVTLGFRAEDATLAADGAGDITAPIYTLELLGDATMITVRIADALVSVKADKNFRAEIGTPVGISVPPEICHLFDRQSGERLGETPPQTAMPGMAG